MITLLAKAHIRPFCLLKKGPRCSHLHMLSLVWKPRHIMATLTLTSLCIHILILQMGKCTKMHKKVSAWKLHTTCHKQNAPHITNYHFYFWGFESYQKKVSEKTKINLVIGWQMVKWEIRLSLWGEILVAKRAPFLADRKGAFQRYIPFLLPFYNKSRFIVKPVFL